MSALFSTKSADAAVDETRPDVAYKEGRRDGQADVNVRAFEKAREDAVRRAYDRGRRDERARRHGSPVLTVILLLAAAAGGFAIFLAAQEGSFSRGGQVVDQSIAGAAATTTRATQDATNKAGAALEDAGARLKKTTTPNS
jgi:hypothetical protein